MFDLDKWQEILGTIQKNKLRTFLTAFGVFWGIFMLVLLLGFGNGMQHGIQREFADESINSLWIWQGRTSLPFNGLKPGREIFFKNNDLTILANQVQGLERVAPRTRLSGEFTLNYKEKNSSYQVFGANSDFFKLNGEKVVSGRNINPIDDQEKRKIIVIGQRIKDVLFGKDVKNEETLGKYIKIKGVYFQLVGIFTSKSNQGRNEERAYIPFLTLQSIYNQFNQVQLMAMSTKPGVSAKDIEGKVRLMLSKSHKFDIKDDQAIGINNNEENWLRFENLFKTIKLYVFIIGMLTLFAGVIGVSNIMMIIVKERTKEIGVRKALGATPFSIISLILQESIIITAMSGYLGLLAGVGLLELLKYAIISSGDNLPYFGAPEVDFGTILIAVIILVFAGALAGFFPALRAANIKPIEALRAD